MIELRRFVETDIPLVTGWLDDAESRRRLGGMRLPVEDGFVAYEDHEPVAFVHVEHLDVSTAALLVAPHARRRGVGRRVVAHLLETELAGRQVLFTAEPDNAASIRLLEGAGFERVGTDEDGFLEYRRG